MAAIKTATIKINGREVILRQNTALSKYRAGLVKEWGRGFALLCNWAWACLPKSEWENFPEPIDLVELVPIEGEDSEAFAVAVTSLFDEAKEPAGNAGGGAS